MWWAIEWYDLLERLGDPDAGQEKERPVVNLEFGGKGQNRLASPVGEKKKKKNVWVVVVVVGDVTYQI